MRLVLFLMIAPLACSAPFLLAYAVENWPPRRGWQRWFAWHPVKVGLEYGADGRRTKLPDRWIWLRRVERRLIVCSAPGSYSAVEIMQYRDCPR